MFIYEVLLNALYISLLMHFCNECHLMYKKMTIKFHCTSFGFLSYALCADRKDVDVFKVMVYRLVFNVTQSKTSGKQIVQWRCQKKVSNTSKRN